MKNVKRAKNRRRGRLTGEDACPESAGTETGVSANGVLLAGQSRGWRASRTRPIAARVSQMSRGRWRCAATTMPDRKATETHKRGTITRALYNGSGLQCH